MAKYITTKAAAEILGVHQETVRRWARHGCPHLAGVPLTPYRRAGIGRGGSVWVFDADTIDAICRERKQVSE